MADQKNTGTDSSFEPTDKLESFLIGLIAFIQQFLRTLRDLAFNQAEISRAIKNQNAEGKYTKPVTFITLISFMAMRIFRFGVLTLLLSLGTFSCSAVSVTETDYPSFWDELKLPSFSEIVLYGIPTLIIILLVSQLLKLVLLKGPVESGKTLVTVTYYSVGFQYITYLVLFSAISLIVYLESNDYLDFSQYHLDYLAIIVTPIFLFWVIFVFYRLVAKTITENHLRVAKRGWRQFWLLLWSIILIAVTTLSEWGMAYSLAQLEIEERESKFLFSIGLVDFTESIGGTYTIDLLIRNNSNDAVPLISDKVFLYGKLVHQGQITDSCVGQAPVIVLQPNEVCWLTISVENAGEEYFSLFYSFDDMIRFDSVSLAGGTKTLSAYIHLDETIFKLSEFE